MTTPSQAKINRARTKLRLLEKRHRQKKVTEITAKKKVVTNTGTKKASRNLGPRTLEEICAAKPDYELIDMEDGTKSCRKKCVDPKPVRSTSKSRKCIAGTKAQVLEPVAKKASKTSLGTRTLEEMCAAKPDYELIDMEDGTKSCRKKCVEPKPVRSTSQSRKCIKGVVRPPGKTKRKRSKKVNVEDEPEYDENDENHADDYDEDDEDDADAEDLSFIVHEDDMDERGAAELEKFKNKKREIKTARDCFELLTTEEIKAEINRRKTDSFERALNFEDSSDSSHSSSNRSDESDASIAEGELGIKEILDKKVEKTNSNKKKTYYLVWWEGEDKNQADWSLKKELLEYGAGELIKHYEEQFPKGKSRKSSSPRRSSSSKVSPKKVAPPAVALPPPPKYAAVPDPNRVKKRIVPKIINAEEVSDTGKI
jgi:hypothetical protein